MTADARFEDADEAPLHLKAESAEDLPVISALVQDAVLTATDMRWERQRRCFVLLLNRFRWEDKPAAERQQRPFERVRAMLVVGDVLQISTQGLDRRDEATVHALLHLDWQPAEEGAGRLLLTLAGDGAIAIRVECLDVTLRDVTRPYCARAAAPPAHPEG